MRAGAKSKKKVNIFYLFILIILICVFIFLMYKILKWLYATNKTKKVTSDIINQVIQNPIDQTSNSQDLEIDFNKLIKLNSQVVGWIKVENTDINYPILKSNDNDYYLHYDFFNQVSQNGWIFMDYRNNSNFEDSNTVIFGHNIKSGIMFSDLKKIYNGSIDKSSKILIYTKSSEVLKYQIYSTYMESPDELSISPYITSNEYEKFSEEMKSRSKYNYNVNVDKNKSRTITLSTCDSTGEKRILVHAILSEKSK